MRTAHLFAGGGGGILADLVLGHTPVLAVENNSDCCAVLRERKKDGWFPEEMQIYCGDIRDWDPVPWQGRVDQISAGFPCQDISCAGKGAGISGERSGLVWEVFRAVDVIRPAFIFLENSPVIRTRGRREIIAALLERGYSYRDGTVAAADVGAPHLRKRWWLLAANADGQRMARTWAQRKTEWRDESTDSSEVSPDTCRNRLQETLQQSRLSETNRKAIKTAAGYTSAWSWLPHFCGDSRVGDGLADRFYTSKKTRIMMLGNGQVPLQAALAWLLLVDPNQCTRLHGESR